MGEMDFAFLLVAALFAGFIDAVAGGGGLIQVPALMVAMPGEPAATVFGTNKIASIFGTANAAWRYSRTIALPWGIALPAAATAFAFSFVGAAVVTWFPKDLLRPLVLALLVMVLVYTVIRPGFGSAPGTRLSRRREVLLAMLVGAVLGFYDGFFGPGTGSFLIFAFVRWFGQDFLLASGAAKVVNFSTNAAALAYFLPNGSFILSVGVGMAALNVVGALLGTKLALRHGSGFVRVCFVLVASLLILRLGYDLVY